MQCNVPKHNCGHAKTVPNGSDGVVFIRKSCMFLARKKNFCNSVNVSKFFYSVTTYYYNHNTFLFFPLSLKTSWNPFWSSFFTTVVSGEMGERSIVPSFGEILPYFQKRIPTKLYRELQHVNFRKTFPPPPWTWCSYKKYFNPEYKE